MTLHQIKSEDNPVVYSWEGHEYLCQTACLIVVETQMSSMATEDANLSEGDLCKSIQCPVGEYVGFWLMHIWVTCTFSTMSLNCWHCMEENKHRWRKVSLIQVICFHPLILIKLFSFNYCVLNGTSDCTAQLTVVFQHNWALPLFPKVFLLPSVLARKRIWNPKYPICIQLAGGGNSENSWGKEPEADPTSPQKSSSRQVHDVPTTLYLFGRTGREKEEWFRHFLFASTDTEREKQRPSRCVSRSGMRNL